MHLLFDPTVSTAAAGPVLQYLTYSALASPDHISPKIETCETIENDQTFANPKA